MRGVIKTKVIGRKYRYVEISILEKKKKNVGIILGFEEKFLLTFQTGDACKVKITTTDRTFRYFIIKSLNR